MKDKEIRVITIQIETGLTQIYQSLNLGEPSKKIRKELARSAKRIGKEIKAHKKEEAKRAAKALKKDRQALKAEKKKTARHPVAAKTTAAKKPGPMKRP